MQVETALIREPFEQIYARFFRDAKPRSPMPSITVRFRRYANANSKIRLEAGHLQVDISDLLESAPPQVHEALAAILVAKLFRKIPAPELQALYHDYLGRTDVQQNLFRLRQGRGRKLLRNPRGRFHDLRQIFAELNRTYFASSLPQAVLGWSSRPSRTTLGHYDPSHNTIVITSMLDAENSSDLLVRFILYHEMLHIRFPTENNGMRRCVHTKDFRAAEKEFENYAKAKLELKKFVAEINGSLPGKDRRS